MISRSDEEGNPLKTSCNAHCKTCGRHFSGTTAFDQHRIGPVDDRHCEDPGGVEGLFPYESTCRLTEFDDRGEGIPQEAVVWSTVAPS
jgi:hypothetical protein